MNTTNAWTLGCLVVAIGITPGCGGSSSTSTPASGAGGDADEYEVISPEEARSEAVDAINETNADAEFEALSAEIEAELGDGG